MLSLESLLLVVVGAPLVVGVLVGVIARQAPATPPPATGPFPAASTSAPAALGPVPIGAAFSCRELGAIGFRAAKLVSMAGGRRAPAVMRPDMLAPAQHRALGAMHDEGRVYGAELMRFIHHGDRLDLTRQALVFADVGATSGTIALLVRDQHGAVQLRRQPADQ